MTLSKKSPGEVRDLLASVEIDVRELRWPSPGFVIIDGEQYAPHSESGTLIIDGRVCFSAAWR